MSLYDFLLIFHMLEPHLDSFGMFLFVTEKYVPPWRLYKEMENNLTLK